AQMQKLNEAPQSSDKICFSFTVVVQMDFHIRDARFSYLCNVGHCVGIVFFLSVEEGIARTLAGRISVTRSHPRPSLPPAVHPLDCRGPIGLSPVWLVMIRNGHPDSLRRTCSPPLKPILDIARQPQVQITETIWNHLRRRKFRTTVCSAYQTHSPDTRGPLLARAATTSR